MEPIPLAHGTAHIHSRLAQNIRDIGEALRKPARPASEPATAEAMWIWNVSNSVAIHALLNVVTLGYTVHPVTGARITSPEYTARP